MPVPNIGDIQDQIASGQAEDAADTLQYLVEQAPTAVTTHILLAQALEARSMYREALAVWRTALFLLPTSSPAYEGIRRCLEALHRPAGIEQPSVDNEIVAAPEAASVKTGRGFAFEADEDPIDEDLDLLIRQLESAPRIMPRTDADLEDLEDPALDDTDEDLVSETLARIYEAQQQYEEAARVYDQLSQLQPDRADFFTERAEELRARNR